MDFQAIYDHLRAIGAPGLESADEPREPNPEDKKDKGRRGDPFVVVRASDLVEFCLVCRDDPRLGFELLVDLTATDPATDDEHLWLGLQLLSAANKQRLAVKCLIPKADAKVESLCPVWNAARWHEREAAEMFGIEFIGHPDPRHILLPDDWLGFPMRKDYEFPKEYHGISCE